MSSALYNFARTYRLGRFVPALHILIALHFWFGIYYDWMYVKLPLDLSKKNENSEEFSLVKSKLRFLTIWDCILQSVFFTICSLNDVVGNTDAAPKRPPFIRKLRDWFLTSLALPVSATVATSFWAIYAIDRELILPKILDTIFPTWLNHLMHTNVFIFALFELIFGNYKYPKRSTGLITLIGFMLLYLVWLIVIYSSTGKWVYPFLEKLGLVQLVVFFLATLFQLIGIYVLGEKLASYVRAKKHPISSKHKANLKKK